MPIQEEGTTHNKNQCIVDQHTCNTPLQPIEGQQGIRGQWCRKHPQGEKMRRLVKQLNEDTRLGHWSDASWLSCARPRPSPGAGAAAGAGMSRSLAGLRVGLPWDTEPGL
eukprot:TRINITY_DN7341_c0_g1_i3.p1 TRINITY_DN7341_c0_g1~~TRINITY_DN7341_c0_g1_i3.p1  ORF type:complete len:110 (+),score=6.65 TRINITY_DN7341_c0_g1_i3:1-330(+)